MLRCFARRLPASSATCQPASVGVVRTCGIARSSTIFSTTVPSQVRWASSNDKGSNKKEGGEEEGGLTNFGGVQEGDSSGAGDSSALSENVNTEEGEEEADEDQSSDFDVEAAAAQEIHDLVVAIHRYVNNLYEGEYTMKTERASAQFFDGMVTKLLGLMTKTVVTKMIASANKPVQSWLLNEHGDQAFRHLVEKTKWYGETSPYPKMFTHSPHELMNTRSDIPAQQIEYAVSCRDKHTLTLMEELCTGKNEAWSADGLIRTSGNSTGSTMSPNTTRLANALHNKLEQCTEGLQSEVVHSDRISKTSYTIGPSD